MSLSREEKLARLRLWRTPRIGPATFQTLLDEFGSAEEAIERLPAHLKSQKRQALKICSRDQAVKEIEALHKMGGRFVFAVSEEFPYLLSQIEDAPPLLATVGKIELLHRPTLAIVGSRNASLNGKRLTRDYASTLGQAGHVIASGLAKGIDAAAHEAALELGTIAVVAGGLDVIYPRENTDLHHQIAKQGLLISEQPLGMPTSARLFPLRNRLVSGLSLGTLVVEANARSGSLITARLAAEQGREVFAIPGSPLEGRAEGTNQLIKQEANLVTSPEDILEALDTVAGPGFEPPKPTPAQPLPADASLHDLILQNLSPEPVPIDTLALECQVTAALMQPTLADLEMAGLIERHPGGHISKAA